MSQIKIRRDSSPFDSFFELKRTEVKRSRQISHIVVLVTQSILVRMAARCGWFYRTQANSNVFNLEYTHRILSNLVQFGNEIISQDW